MTALLWGGAAGAWLFVVVFLVDGATRPGYHPVRHPVSALALGSRGWVQTGNFVLCGAAIALGAIALGRLGVFLALAIGVFGLALIASGVFPMDPMRGYPPGTPDGTPEETSMRHRLHDDAGMVVFAALPIAAAIAAFTVESTGWRWYAGITAALFAAVFVAFGHAWENDSPRAGLLQRITIVIGWSWLGAVFAREALSAS